MGGIARNPLPRRQRGLALLVLLTLFAVTGTYMLVSALNKGSVSLNLARADKNRAVMQQAKAALIAWSASETLQGANFQPGRLPCPDRDNNGAADASCTTIVSRLGRLPYKTLGIGELRDASGELLWYAVSNNFRTGASVINSDTQGTLTVSGLAPANNAVAVVLAPGMLVGAQIRSWAGASCSLTSDPCNIASNYLEDINGDANTVDYIAAVENVSVPAQLPYPFNDQLLLITQHDLLAIVEPVVAARIERDIVAPFLYISAPGTSTNWTDSGGPNKSRYFDAWGAFPFAAPFASPGISSFTGTAGTLEGLLPVVSSLGYNWTPGSGSIVKTGGGGAVSSTNCATTTATNLICSMTWSGFLTQPVIRMSGTVAGIGLSFVQLTQLSDVSSSGGLLSARSLSGSLTSLGAGIVTLDARLPVNSLFFGNKTVTITINNGGLITSALISPLDATAGWFNSNQWYKQTYYVVSAGYAPGGAGSCNFWSSPPPSPPSNPPPSPRCLSVANLASPYANPTLDTRALVVLTGRSLSGAARPNGTLSDYVEGQNASTGDYSFEHGLSKLSSSGTAINDKVVVVAP